MAMAPCGLSGLPFRLIRFWLNEAEAVFGGLYPI